MKKQITQEGFDDLMNELENRKSTIRTQIANDIELAREQGDLSENAAYKSAMEAKEFNENRISELESTIKNLEVYEGNEKNNAVELGESIVLTNRQTGLEMKFQLVSSSEANPQEKKISVDSPIGKAIVGKKYGSEVKVELPTGTQIFIVKKV